MMTNKDQISKKTTVKQTARKNHRQKDQMTTVKQTARKNHRQKDQMTTVKQTARKTHKKIITMARSKLRRTMSSICAPAHHPKQSPTTSGSTSPR
jgi:hypothetical protein